EKGAGDVPGAVGGGAGAAGGALDGPDDGNDGGAGEDPATGPLLIWLSAPTRSSMCQVSTILPFAIRLMSIASMITGFPLAGRPRKVPDCVPFTVLRTTTLSPSAITSAIVKRRSENPERNEVRDCFSPSIPVDWPGPGS